MIKINTIAFLFGLVGVIVSITIFIATDKLSGGEFITFFISSVVLALGIHLSPNLSELSIVGNVLKMKEVRGEVEKSLLKLKQAQVDTYRTLLLTAKEFPGGFVDIGEFKDRRVDKFITVYNAIKNFDLVYMLKDDILSTIDVVIKGQLYWIVRISPGLINKINPEIGDIEMLSLDSEFPKPKQITSWIHELENVPIC